MKGCVLMKKKTIALTALASATAIALGYYLYKENKTIDSETFVYRSNKVPKAFHGSKILLISDLHNNLFKKEQKALLEHIKMNNPDYIFICGDLVHAENTNLKNMQPIKYLIEGIANQYSVFFIAGNHEAKNTYYLELCEYLQDQGVIVLNDEIITLQQDDDSIDIVGCLDPRFHGNHKPIYKRTLETLANECENEFKILLAHRPELLNHYAKCGYDLVFSGHSHGGVIQIKKRQGLFAPNQGFMPKYCDGKYLYKDTTMFVSRGLGNASCPIRINTRPHLLSVVIEYE